MKPTLVLYATREGQTRRIAEHVASTIRAHGVPTQVMDVAHPVQPIDLSACGAVILAASVHAGKHEREMVRFVKENRSALEQVPTVFLSTSLSEAGAAVANRTAAERSASHADAVRMIEEFFAAIGFRPTAYRPVAGALRYTRYNWLVRLVMKHISKASGGSTDTSRDHEYTDWIDLDRFIDELVRNRFEIGAEP